LNDKRGDEHGRGQQSRGDAGEQAGDQKKAADKLTVSGDVAENRGDAVGGEALSEGRDTARAENLAPAVRNENQAAREAQDEGRRVAAPTVHFLELLGPITLFVSVYLATFLAIGYAMIAVDLRYQQWAALLAAMCATAFTVRIIERGRWRLGLFVPPQIAAIDFVRGALLATLLILFADAALLFNTNLRHARGAGFPWLELMAVFAPAAVHEELVFRGYLFQKMRMWNRFAAMGVTSIVFAVLHGTNRGITIVAVVNLVIAGILLALAYERFERLWFPIGIHLAWNLLSGPILGYHVSGYVANSTVLRVVGSGPLLVTGGAFGIEGSLWMTAAELGGIFLLRRTLKRDA